MPHLATTFAARLALLAAFAGVLPAQQRPQEPQARYGSEITVALHTVVVRVVDSARQPILGLAPEDFVVTVGKREFPVVAVDWVSSAVPRVGLQAEELPAAPGPGPEPGAPAAQPEGSLVVFFVQADLTPLRVGGHLRQRGYNRELLASLDPADRVAVVAFDSHLKLWQDWTTDRDAVMTAIHSAVRYGGKPLVRGSDDPSTLAAHFDFAAARKVASPERALEVTAQALTAFPGEKVIVYQGWGMGRFGAYGFSLTSEFYRAAEAVHAAQASVYAVDVTSADGHDLALGLYGIAAATGGTYSSNFAFPSRIPKALRGAIDGHYVLTLDFADLPDAGGLLEIRLREKKGRVLYRPTLVRVAAEAQ